MKEYSQKVVPLRPEVTDELNRNAQTVTNDGSSRKADVVSVGKLKFTVYTNTPSQEAMDNFNEFFQVLFETSIGGNENEALPA